MIETIPIKETPFTAIRTDKTWHLTMGKYRLETDLESLEECELAAFDTSWDMILKVIAIMIEEYQENEKNKKELDEVKERIEKAQKSVIN